MLSQILKIASLKNINKTRINGYFLHYFHTFAKNQKIIRKIYLQNLSAKFIRKIYPQNLSAKSIRKIFRKIYPQNLSAKSIREKCAKSIRKKTKKKQKRGHFKTPPRLRQAE